MTRMHQINVDNVETSIQTKSSPGSKPEGPAMPTWEELEKKVNEQPKSNKSKNGCGCRK
jgi:hypothetical protein